LDLKPQIHQLIYTEDQNCAVGFLGSLMAFAVFIGILLVDLGPLLLSFGSFTKLGVWVRRPHFLGGCDITTLSCRTKNYPKMNKSKNQTNQRK
jgi:hypothetical protein